MVTELSAFAEVSCEPQMAIVCVVGDGLQRDPFVAARVLTSVGDVPLRMVSQAAGRRNITFVIRERDVPTTLSRLHDTFFAPYPVPASVAGTRG